MSVTTIQHNGGVPLLYEYHVMARLISHHWLNGSSHCAIVYALGTAWLADRSRNERTKKKQLEAGQALREDAPDVRKEIDENIDNLPARKPAHEMPVPSIGGGGGGSSHAQTPPPQHQQQQRTANFFHHRPGVPAGIPPSVSYSPSTSSSAPTPIVAGARPDPPEAEGVSGYRQPPLRYTSGGVSGRGMPVSGRGHPGGAGRGGRGPPPQQHQFGGLGPHPQGGYHHQGFYNHYPPHAAHYGHHGPHGYVNGAPPPPQSQQPPPPQFTKDGLVNPRRSSRANDFPPHASVGTAFTMSDVSSFGASVTGAGLALGESMKDSTASAATRKVAEQTMAAVAEGSERSGLGSEGVGSSGGGGGGENNVKASTTSSSSKDSDPNLSFTMSDLMMSGLTRTHSFPDLMLSTGDLLPPMDSDISDRDESKERGGGRASSRPRGKRTFKMPFGRRSSSDSSEVGTFQPIRDRINTASTGILSNLNDAMSIMSLDSKKSGRSEASSWIDNFKSMQSIGSDMNPYEAGGSAARSAMMLDDGSVRSLLSDYSNEMTALDLAEPLLPPLGLTDSADFMGGGVSENQEMSRPDPDGVV